jgi:hypothetical protein
MIRPIFPLRDKAWQKPHLKDQPSHRPLTLWNESAFMIFSRDDLADKARDAG